MSAYVLRLTDRRNQEEESRVHSEIKGQNVSVIFDGTSRLGETLDIIIRFVSPDWRIEQRLVRVQMLSKSLTDEEIARELISVLSVNFRHSIGQSSCLYERQSFHE